MGKDNTAKENKTPRRRKHSTKSNIRKNEEQKNENKPKRKMSAKTYSDKAAGEVIQVKIKVKEEDSSLKINEKKSKSNTPVVRSRDTSPPLQKLPPKPPAGKRVKKANNSKLMNNQDKNTKTNKKDKNNNESLAKEPSKAKNADSASAQQSANITDQFSMNNFITQSDSIKQNKNDSNILIEKNNQITKLEITSQPSYKPSIFKKPSRGTNMNMENAHEAFKSKKKSRTAFHISLNESTMSFLGNSSNGFLEMSSGLVVDQNQKRPDYNFHISIDESSELNQSAAVIRNQIFNENNEWNFQETTPGRYDQIDTESYNKAILELQNYSDSLENSLTLDLNESGLDADNPTGLLNLPGTNPTSTRMSFLFNDNTGLLCKNCFSSECYHMENLSSVYQTKRQPEDIVNRITTDENNNENSETMIETMLDSTNNNNLIDSLTAKAFYEKNNIDRPSSSGSNVARDIDKESAESETQKNSSIKHGNEIDSIDLLTSLNLKLKEILDLSDHIKIIKMDEVFHRNHTGLVVPFSEIEVELSNTLTEVLSENCDQSEEDKKDNDQSEEDIKDNEVVDISHRSFKERLDHSESFRIDHLPEYNFDYSNNALRYTPTVGDNKYPKAVRRNSFMRENSNESKEMLCYDSDYDDASYLNGCITNTQSSFEKLEIANNIFYANLAENKTEVASPITPPLRCSSPTELVERPAVPKRKTSLRPMSSLFTVPEENNESSSMSVTPQSSSRQPTSNDHQPNTENGDLSDRETSPIQLNHQDSINNENNNKSPTETTYLNENTQLTLSEAIDSVTTNHMAIQQHSHLSSDSLNNSPCVPTENTITDEMKNSTINENNIGYFMNRLEDESMLQDSINDITFRNLQQNQQPLTQASDDNLTTKELKALAREQLQMQHIIDQGGTIDDLQISEEAKTTDIHGNELDSEDELQWFLQEKRKKILNSEFFSSDSSDVLPEDEEVRKINLPGRYQQKTDKVITETVKNVPIDTQLEESTKTFTNKSTNTDPDLLQTYDRQNIDLEELGLYKHIDILVLNSNSAHASESSDISNPSGIDSGVDSRSSLTNRSLQNVQTDNQIVEEDYSYNNDQRPYTEQDHRLFNEEQRLYTADLPFTSEGESANNENYLMNHFLRQQSHFHNEMFDKRQTNVSYYNQRNLGVNTEEGVTQNTPLTEELRYINKDTPQRTPSALYRMNLRFLADKATPDIENLSRKSSSPSIESKQSSLINKFSKIYSTPLKLNTVLATDKQTKFETFSPKPPPYTKKYKSTFNRNFNSASSTSRLIRQNEAKKSKIIETKLHLQRHVTKPGDPSSRSLPRISDYNGLVIQGHDIFKRKRKASATSRNLNHRKDNDAPVLTAPYRTIKQRQNMLL